MAVEEKWLLDITADLGWTNVKYTYDQCLDSAANFPDAGAWRAAEPKLYKAAAENLWLKQLKAALKWGTGVWTFRSCLTDARNHPSFQSWQNTASYQAACRRNWLDDICHIRKWPRQWAFKLKP